MLHDPDRHEPLAALPWDEGRARATIERIVADTVARFDPVHGCWPTHPLDRHEDDRADAVATTLYDGAAGVVWALGYLHAVGAVAARPAVPIECDRLLQINRAWHDEFGATGLASWLMGQTPIHMMALAASPNAGTEAALEALIEGNIANPARELMWGSPGTLLAALFLFERTGRARWAELFRATAQQLRSELEWSEAHRCAYWRQHLYGRESTYLDAVHGFVATALPLIRGRHLLDAAQWEAWRATIVETISRTADREGDQANWRPQLEAPTATQKRLVQFCHGSPGFVICLGAFPGTELDPLLLAAGETVWSAGPLAKGSNLCHGTGGNGYAFLKLHGRSGDPRWLERARAFAMHGIAQTERDARRYGQGRYSLWTGDPGFAIYLWDCLRAEGQFPTLDVFFAGGAGAGYDGSGPE
ncbi:MAG: LanC-like protein [Burkholderiales bacterium]|nr:LanC-like protein [Burkholderiales bacterium]